MNTARPEFGAAKARVQKPAKRTKGAPLKTAAKPKPPTKLPKGPSEGSLSPADKVATDTAKYEALAREHGCDLSEEGFNEALKKVGALRRSVVRPT